MIPVMRAFVEAHGIAGVTVVADAGMMSEANLKDIEDAGWSFIVGGKLSEVPYQIARWHWEHPDTEIPDQLILTQPTPMGTQERPADPDQPTTGYPGRPGPPQPPRHRRLGGEGREGRRGACTDQTEPVHHLGQRHQDREP